MIMENVNRLERGLAIMAETKKQVDYIKADVEQTSKVVAIEKEKT
jgi:hypothetical protein